MKDKNYFSILNAVLRLEVVKGHLRWKIADVSRLSGVQRTLIYYYFGKSKESILENAMKAIGEEFFGFTSERLQLWKDGKVKESVMRSREMISKAPHLVEFFFHWRHQKGEISTMLKKLERNYPKKLREIFPHLSELDADAAYTIFWGMVLMPDLSEQVVVRILKVMKLHP